MLLLILKCKILLYIKKNIKETLLLIIRGKLFKRKNRYEEVLKVVPLHIFTYI